MLSILVLKYNDNFFTVISDGIYEPFSNMFIVCLDILVFIDSSVCEILNFSFNSFNFTMVCQHFLDSFHV